MLCVARPHRSLLAGLFLCAWLPTGLALEKVGENELKAAYIFNFIQFIEWPYSDALSKSDWTICVSPFSPLKRPLMALEGRSTSNGKPIRIRLWEAAELADCRMIVLNEADTERAARALNASTGRLPVLTIADDSANRAPGIMINLSREGSKVVFDIDSDAMGKVGLTVSSRLLRLSRGAR